MCRRITDRNNMETIMSPISIAPAAVSNAAAQFSAHGFGATLQRWWSAYTARRAERLAMSRLREMSDRQLKDIGLTRSEIEFAARHGTVRDRAADGLVLGCWAEGPRP
jgi:uncharacterized protein YjiS (DUF1127 family)